MEKYTVLMDWKNQYCENEILSTAIYRFNAILIKLPTVFACFFSIEFYEVFVYFEYQLVCCIIYKYFLWASLPLTLFHRLFFVYLFYWWFPFLCKVWIGPICLWLLLFLLPWEIDLRKYCYNLCQRAFCLCSLLGILWYVPLYLSL